jgi:hypothetical protein
MCENRFEKMKEAGFVKQPWTQEEDAIIERCIDEVSNQYTYENVCMHPLVFSSPVIIIHDDFIHRAFSNGQL